MKLAQPKGLLVDNPNKFGFSGCCIICGFLSNRIGDTCPHCEFKATIYPDIEIGDIFPLLPQWRLPIPHCGDCARPMELIEGKWVCERCGIDSEGYRYG